MPTSTSISFRIGARASRLSLAQSGNALRKLRQLLPNFHFELVPYSSPGDEDRLTDLRISDPDFFTRYLDHDVLSGKIDGALHSAKDMPDPLPDGIDWCWLPWPEDRRDVLVYRPGLTADDLPGAPVIGVSSDRRAQYCRERWPNALHRPIRGNIEHRLQQLDNGDFDIVPMAGCALVRLDLTHRISEWVPLDELDAPPAQGYLGLTFRHGDPRLTRLRNLLIKAVTLISAGPGDPGLCTIAGRDALHQADVCLYDALAPRELLADLPPHAEAIDVGKRRHKYTVGRQELENLLVNYCRQGKRVVRLKGGDAGIFARLSQETEALAHFNLPFRVLPGVSSLHAATTPTGLMLTRKGTSRGFCVVTPEQLGDQQAAVGMNDRRNLPLALFMAVSRIRDVVAELLAEGRPAGEPATMVYAASTPDEVILTATLATIADIVEAHDTNSPGLLLVGDIADAHHLFDRSHFPLEGKHVLLTCGSSIMARARLAVHDLGGIPIPMPFIRLVPEKSLIPVLRDLHDFDWLVLTSPSAVDCLWQLLTQARVDPRQLPRIIVCGSGTADALMRYGIHADACPASDYSAQGMLALAAECIPSGARVLRLRSDKATPAVADALTARGARVADHILYRNEVIRHEHLPPLDAIFFASASAVDAFVDCFTPGAAEALTLVAIGKPTADRLLHHGLTATVVSEEGTAPAAIHALAAWYTTRAISLGI